MSNESKDSPINEDVENNVAEQVEEAIAGELIDDVEAGENAVTDAVYEQIEALKADV